MHPNTFLHAWKAPENGYLAEKGQTPSKVEPEASWLWTDRKMKWKCAPVSESCSPAREAALHWQSLHQPCDLERKRERASSLSSPQKASASFRSPSGCMAPGEMYTEGGMWWVKRGVPRCLLYKVFHICVENLVLSQCLPDTKKQPRRPLHKGTRHGGRWFFWLGKEKKKLPLWVLGPLIFICSGHFLFKGSLPT